MERNVKKKMKKTKVLCPQVKLYSTVSSPDVFYFALEYRDERDEVNRNSNENQSTERRLEASKTKATELLTEQKMAAAKQEKDVEQNKKYHDENRENVSDVSDVKDQDHDYSDDSFEDEGDCVIQSARSGMSGSAPDLSRPNLAEAEISRPKRDKVQSDQGTSTRRLENNRSRGVDTDVKVSDFKPPLPPSDDYYKKYERETPAHRIMTHEEETAKGDNEPFTKSNKTTKKQRRRKARNSPSHDTNTSSLDNRSPPVSSVTVGSSNDDLIGRAKHAGYRLDKLRPPSSSVVTEDSTILWRKSLSTVTLTTAKKQRHKLDMERIMHEIALRGEHKEKSLETQAKKLQRNVDALWEENYSLRKMHRSQEKEMRDIHEFVSMTSLSLQDVRRDIRKGEEQCLSLDAKLRKKNRRMVSLQNECAKYEKLLKLASVLPTEEELEEKIENALNKLAAKEDRITELEKLAVKREKMAAKEKQKENKNYRQLQSEIQESITECDELRGRIKVAEKKLQKTNLYSRQLQLKSQQALPALTWYPLPAEQTSQSKVKKWLNEVEDHM